MHTVRLDVAAALATPGSCPSCGAGDLAAVMEEDGLSFACPRCDRTRPSELGVLVPEGRGRSHVVEDATSR